MVIYFSPAQLRRYLAIYTEYAQMLQEGGYRKLERLDLELNSLGISAAATFLVYKNATYSLTHNKKKRQYLRPLSSAKCYIPARCSTVILTHFDC